MTNISALILVFFHLFVLLGFCDGHKIFSDSDVSQILLSGTQAKRISDLNYQKACKCQCKDLTVFNKETGR